MPHTNRAIHPKENFSQPSDKRVKRTTVSEDIWIHWIRLNSLTSYFCVQIKQ